jgi:hypothetical protein
MFKGKHIKEVEFYNLLFKNNEFTSELGKVSLASGRLEAELILFFNRKGVIEKVNESTLGWLIKVGKKNNLLDKNLIQSLELVLKQRNYFTHNIYALFTELIDVTILERNNLIDTDVVTYSNYAWQLSDNLESLADLVSRK